MLGLAVAGLFLGRWLALTTADRLWAESLGAGDAHTDIMLLRLALSVGAFFVAGVWYIGHLFLLCRQIGAVQVPRQVGDLEIFEHVPRRYLLVGAVVTGIALAVVSSYGAGDWWILRAVAGTAEPVGLEDPLLGRDAGYYLFHLPWELALHRFALVLAAVATALLTLLYAAIGAVRRQEGRITFLPSARWHLAALSGSLALVLAWGYALEPSELAAGLHAVPFDAILRDVRVPAALVMTVLATAVGAASLAWMRVDRVAIPVVAWTVLLLGTFGAHFVVPPAVAAGRSPERRVAPEVGDALPAARAVALGLVPDSTPVPLAVPDEAFVQRHDEDLARVALWDAFVLTELLNRIARPMPPDPRSTGRFFDAALLQAQTPAGAPVPVFLAVREPDSLGYRASDEARGAAIGAVAVSATRIGAGGTPLFVPRLSSPDSTVAAPTDLQLTSAETWFAPSMSGPAYPAAGEGAVGIAVTSVGRRVALAWALQSPRLLSRTAVPAGTVVAVERAVAQRLARYAPFAQFGAAWPTVLDGRLVWAAWGYVSSEAFPLGATVVWRGRAVRYLQAGFLGTVDAASGTTVVYGVPEADPLSRAWQQLFPVLVRPAAELPRELTAQLRYPAELFRVQVDLLRSRPGRARLAEPYWAAGTSAGDTVPRLRLRAIDEVQLEPRVAAVIEGTMHRGVPWLRVLHYPEPYTLAGPTDLERPFADAAPGGAAVGGRVRLLAFEDGAVGVQSFYADSGTFAGVVAGWQGAAGRGSTVTSALRQVERRPGDGLQGATPFEAARAWFRRLDQARVRGDWAAFGEAWEGLRAALQLSDSSGAGAVAAPRERN